MKKHTVFNLIVMLFLISVFAIACSEDNTTPFDTEATADDIDDAAEDFAATLADPDEGMLQYWMEESEPPRSSDMVKDNGDRNISDTTFTRGGLTVTIDRTFYDADGNESEEYDSLTTVRMTRLLTINGTRGGVRRQATIDHEGLIDVTGITPEDTVRALSGNGSRSVSSEFQARWRAVTREFEALHTWTRNNIQRHIDRELYPYPLSGSVDVTTDITKTITRNNETIIREVSVEFSVYFDGTQYAMVEVVDGPTYWIDLETGLAYNERP